MVTADLFYIYPRLALLYKFSYHCRLIHIYKKIAVLLPGNIRCPMNIYLIYNRISAKF
jgi:hypothetical protein